MNAVKRNQAEGPAVLGEPERLQPRRNNRGAEQQP